jgi:hypothetical protein
MLTWDLHRLLPVAVPQGAKALRDSVNARRSDEHRRLAYVNYPGDVTG